MCFHGQYELYISIGKYVITVCDMQRFMFESNNMQI